ncbi:ABC transporter permease [Actinocorallia sp. B10E7]|uniref:ABC transporter permease n=1 Tax=Actinocorallia sp. B10E7 TaxID=3153558 RepID=UPI00325D037A
MSLLAVKLRRDLRASWSRFALMVLAIAVSLTVFGGVLLAWATIGRETENAYLGTEPASATIVLDEPVPAEQMADLVTQARESPGVLQAIGRTQFSTEVQVDGRTLDVPMLVFAAAPDDPMRMVRFDARREGSWPPASGEILLRGDSLDLLGVNVGDTMTIKTPSGQSLSVRVRDTVYDPSLAPSPQEQRAYGYLSTASLGSPVMLDQLKIQASAPGGTEPSRERATVASVAGEVGDRLQRDRGLTVEEIQVPRPYAHPHQWQADVFLLSLLAGGAAALLLSTILVANMLNTLFTRQIPQIGIMKAIGAGSGRIGRFYLVMTLLVAAAATLLALGPAIGVGRLLSGLLDMLGVQAASLTAPWWTYAVIVAVGLALPSLMALWPLIRTSRTTVRAAIDHHGGGTRPGKATGVLARIGGIDRLDRDLVMALRNTVRRPARFWLSVGLLACAGTVFVAGMSLNSGTQAVDEQRKSQRTWDVEVALADPAATEAVTKAVSRVPGVTRVQAWQRTPTSVAATGRLPFTRTYPDQGHGSVAINTVQTGRSPSKLLEGRWLKPGETRAIVLNQITRDNSVPDLGAGDDVRLFLDGKPTTWRIVGIIEEREAGGGGVYATAEGLAQATGRLQQVNQLRVFTDGHDEQTRKDVAERINTALAASGVTVKSAASISRSDAASSGHLGPVLAVLLGVALPLGVVGAIGLASTMSANVLDRTREFGVMHALGARPSAVRRIVVTEGIILALTSCIVAAVPALALTALLGDGLGELFQNAPLPYRISAPAVAIWVGLAVLGSALATDAAATRASRITVREALAYL